jgi:SAM-dependent methyltransferase
MYLREGPGSTAQQLAFARPLWFNGRIRGVVGRTVRKSLPALLPGIHQISAKTAFNRYPQIFAAAAAACPDAKHILSFGCSTGEECATLQLYYPCATILGADVNPLSLWRAQRRYRNGSISFAYAADRALTSSGPFDAIFCLTVLRDTRLDGKSSIQEAYPFDRFDERVSFLHSLLKPGGLLVFYGNMYRFCDTSVAGLYDVVPLVHTPVGKNITFARDGANDGLQYLDALFCKRPNGLRPIELHLSATDKMVRYRHAESRRADNISSSRCLTSTKASDHSRPCL